MDAIDTKAVINAEVLTISRMAHRVLQELGGTEIQHNFSVISNNLISGKRFEDARKLCSQVSGIEQLKMVSKIQKAQIIKAEIGDLVFKEIVLYHYY